MNQTGWEDSMEIREFQRELQEREARLELLDDISRQLARGTEIGEIIRRTVSTLAELFPGQRIVYSAIAPDGELAVLHSIEPPGMPSMGGVRYNLNDLPAYFARLRGQHPIAVEDVREDPILGPFADEMVASGVAALLDVPLHHSSELIGLLCCNASRPHSWSESEIRTFSTIASYLSTALARTRMQEEREHACWALENRVEQLEILSRLTEAVVRAEAMEEIFSQALGGLEQILAANSAAILMQDESGQLRLQVCQDLLSEAYRAKAADYSPWDSDERGISPVVVEDVDRAEEAGIHLGGFGLLLRAEGIRAALFLPLLARGQLLGRCSLFYHHPRGFDAEELRLAQTVASHLALAAERKRSEQQLLHAALHDALTGLPNRALFQDRLELAIRRTRRRTYEGFAVVFVDLDNFKLVNDSLGHTRGDQLLVAIAQRLVEAVRPGDTVARQGGDEFTILIEDVGEVTHVLRVVDRLHEQLTAPFLIGDTEVFTTASIGITTYHSGYESPDEVLRDADTAMYQAKRKGRGRHALFNPEMHTRAVAQLQLELDLRRALEREEFVLHYQPIWDVSGERIVELEALLRWQHPERGLLTPEAFLEQTVETGLIVPLGNWVIRQACAQLARWLAGFGAPTDLGVSVNLGARELTQPGLVEGVAKILEVSGLGPGSLRLEITETSVIEMPEAILDVLNRLRALGVHIHLDDFGTGYSSLSYLHSLPIDALKIDRSFIARILEAGQEDVILRTILILGHHLGHPVTAEGVETAEQLAHLREAGCDRVQGYFLARPLPATEAEALLGQKLGAARSGG